MNIREMFGEMELTKMTKKEFGELPVLDENLQRDTEDKEQISIIKLTSDLGLGGDTFMLEVFRKGDKVNANMSVIEITDEEVDHEEELEKFLDDPSDVGC